MHAVEAGLRRARAAASRPPRWRRSSGARSGGGTRSARAPTTERTLPSRSKVNSGSSDSTTSAPVRSPLACSAAATLARGGERPGPWLARHPRRPRRCDPRGRSPGARPSGSASGRTRCARPSPRELELDRHRRPIRSRQQRAGVAREAVRQHRLDRARARTRWSLAGAPRGPASEPSGTCARRRRCGPTRASCRPRARSAEIASSKSRALAGSIVKVGSSRRSRRRCPRRPTACAADAGLVLDGRIERAAQAAVEHQRLDHVARDLRTPEQTHDSRRRPARAEPHQREVARARIPARTVRSAGRAQHDASRAAPARRLALLGGEQRLRRQKASAALEHRDERPAGAGALGGREPRCARGAGLLTAASPRACRGPRTGRVRSPRRFAPALPA